MFSVEAAITQRLNDTQEERDRLKVLHRSLDSQFRNALGSISKIRRPAMKEDEFMQALKNREFAHSCKPCTTNEDERNFMRDMDKLKTQHREAIEYAKLQVVLDSVKEQRQQVLTELKEKEALLDDLKTGARKIKAAGQLNCTVTELSEFVFSLDPDEYQCARGKGGGTIRKVEEACSVQVDSDRREGTLRITGLPASIEAAHAELLRHSKTITEECALQDELFACLKLPLIMQLQVKHSVHLECSRAAGLCRITGLREAIDTTKEEMRKVPVMKFEMSVDKSAMPFVIGKGGASIKSLRETYDVEADAPKEGPPSIKIVGLRDNVVRASEFLNTLVDDNTEIEDVVVSEKHVLMGALLSGGNALPGLQRELNVKLTLQGNNKNEIAIVGNRMRCNAAKLHILQILDRHVADTLVVSVPDHVVPAVLGKKGAKIKVLREEHPEVAIDLVGDSSTSLHIARGSEDARKAAKKAVLSIIDANHQETVEIVENTLIQLKSARGVALRTELSELKIYMDIVDSNSSKPGTALSGVGAGMGVVALKGSTASVKKGMKLLRQFAEDNFVLELTQYEDSECGVVVSLLGQALQTKHGVEAVRRKSGLQLRGKRSAMVAATQDIDHLLSGTDIQTGYVKIEVSPLAFSPLIGKGGVTIQKFQTEYGVKIDTLRSKNEVRVHCEDVAKVVVARDALVAFLRFARISETVLIPAKFRVEVPKAKPKASESTDSKPSEEVFRFVPFVQEVVGGCNKSFIGPDRFKDSLIFRGAIDRVEEAKSFVLEMFTDYAERILVLKTGAQAAALQSRAATLKVIEAECFGSAADVATGVGIGLDEEKRVVSIRGPRVAVGSAYEKVFEMLVLLFPAEFAVVNFDSKCLRSLSHTNMCDLLGTPTASADFTVDRVGKAVRVSGCDEDVLQYLEALNAAKREFEDRRGLVNVDSAIMGALTGKRGAKLASLAAETETNIQLDRDSSSLYVEAKDKEALAGALTRVRDELAQLERVYWEHAINEAHIGAFMGKSGAHIKQLRADSGASVDVPGNSRVVVVTGEESQVSDAKARVLVFVAEQELKNYSCEVRVPDAALPVVVGAKGGVIRDLQEKSGAHIDVNRARGVALMKGKKECCEAAKDLISALVADFEEKNYSCQAALPDIALSTVVGAKGATIRDIQAKSGARIDIVRDKQIAMLKGKKEHCDIAKDLITSLVENFMEKNFTCELAVPVPALPSVVGAKGATIRDLQDRSGARIDINRDKGLAVFKGKKENCEMAKELVVAFIQDYEEKNYSCDVRVPEAALAAVVGAKGAVIRDLQEKSGARIDINRDKGLAVLKGRKENCEKAMDLINEILEDGGFLQPKNKEADPAPAEDTPVVPKVRSGVIPGAFPHMVARASAVVKNSKSAQRRQRRKERGIEEEEEEEEGQQIVEASGDCASKAEMVSEEKVSPSSVSSLLALPPAPSAYTPTPTLGTADMGLGLGLGAAPAGLGLSIPQRETQPALWGDSLSASPYLQTQAAQHPSGARFPTAAGQTPIGYEKPKPQANLAAVPVPPPALNFAFPLGAPPAAPPASGGIGSDGRYVSKSGFSIRF